MDSGYPMQMLSIAGRRYHYVPDCVAAFAACVLIGASLQSFAQAYPSKPIRVIVPYAAGGAGDIMGRVIGQKLNDAWGQQVVVDMRPERQA